MNKMERRLLDSNIMIYVINPTYQILKTYISAFELYASKISKVEVLGYMSLLESDKIDFELFFDNIFLLGIDDTVIRKAIELKQTRKMTLGDSLIAATALVNQIPLFTRNVMIFKVFQI